MAITEANRLEMHLQFRKTMGDKVADTVMEHLPPTGWADVARKSDVDNLGAIMDTRFAAVNVKFESIERRFEAMDRRFDTMDKRLDGIINGLWAMGTLSSACFLGIFALIATKL